MNKFELNLKELIPDYIEELSENLNAIESKIYCDMGNYSQYTIDVSQELNEWIEEDFITLTNIPHSNYQISLVLEIINPALEKDITVLKNIYDLLNTMVELLKPF